MGLLTTMRNRGGLLVGLIGFAIVAFLVGDVLISGGSFINDARTELGVIDGKSVSYQEFDAKLQQNIENFRNQQRQSNLDENMQGYLNDQTWNQFVQEVIMNKQYDEIGVTVSGDELFDMVQGKNPHPEIQRAFVNQAGVFDRSLVINFLQTMDQRDPSGETRKQWLAFEKSLQEDRFRQKYFNLIRNGLYVTTIQAKTDYTDRARMAEFRYAMLDYTSIPDSTVKVAEGDLNSYYKDHAYKYKQKFDARSLEYLFYEVTPSSSDSAEAKKWIDEKAEYLRSNESKDDSVYISLHAETKFTGAYNKKGTLSPALDTALFNASTGTVYGPFMDAGAYKVAKLLSVKTIPDSVKARHILIEVKNSNIEAARKVADSLKKQIQSGASFAELAKANSKDKGSAEKGGDLGYFAQGMMVQPFNDACFYGSKGEMPVVESQFGVHLIEILDQKNFNRQVRVGVIDRKIEASNSTEQEAYSKINTVRSSISDAKDFEKITPTGNLNKRVAEDIRESERFVAGLENPRELIRWAFKAEKDDVSEVLELGNKFVIARLTAIKDKGTIPLEYVKTQVEAEVKKQKKAEMLIEKFNKASEGVSTIQQVAQKLNIRVDTAKNASFSVPVIPGMAREPEVIGTVFGISKGKLSKPLEGQRGVYMVFVDAIAEPSVQTDFTMNKMQAGNMLKSRAEYEAMEALKENAGVKDYRVKFY